MPSQQISKKKLKAIVFTDIADFTKLSAQDEQKALDLLHKQNDIVKPIVEMHKGEWLKEIGDGLLLSFDSSLNAVRCSIEIQESLKDVEDLNLRIGIHEGEISLIESDILGDDVNIASRIEQYSPVGGIAISGKVQQDISSLPEYNTEFIGSPTLKGVSQKIEIYCISSHDLPVSKAETPPKINILGNQKKWFIGPIVIVVAMLIFMFTMTEKLDSSTSFGGKKIAVLYFENMSNDIKNDIQTAFSFWLPFVEIKQLDVVTQDNKNNINANSIIVKVLFNITKALIGKSYEIVVDELNGLGNAGSSEKVCGVPEDSTFFRIRLSIFPSNEKLPSPSKRNPLFNDRQ